MVERFRYDQVVAQTIDILNLREVHSIRSVGHNNIHEELTLKLTAGRAISIAQRISMEASVLACVSSALFVQGRFLIADYQAIESVEPSLKIRPLVPELGFSAGVSYRLGSHSGLRLSFGCIRRMKGADPQDFNVIHQKSDISLKIGVFSSF